MFGAPPPPGEATKLICCSARVKGNVTHGCFVWIWTVEDPWTCVKPETSAWTAGPVSVEEKFSCMFA